MEKLMTISKKLDTVLKVVQKIMLIVVLVAVLVCGIATIINAVAPNGLIVAESHILDVGSLSIELSPELAPNTGTILKLAWVTFAIAIVFVCVCYYTIGLARKILEPMKAGLPFDESVGHNIKKMAYVFLVYGIVGNLGNMLQIVYEAKMFERIVAMNSGVIQSVTANYVLNLDFLTVFFVLILVSHIFNYGAKLQQLSDETL